MIFTLKTTSKGESPFKLSEEKMKDMCKNAS